MRTSNCTLMALVATTLVACGVDPDKIADHTLYLDDGQRHEYDGGVSFGVIGNTRGPVPGSDRAAGRHGHGDAVAASVVADIGAHVNTDDLQFLVMMGDSVRLSSTSEWKAFDALFAPVLQGQSPAPEGVDARIPGVPVAGEREAIRDKRFKGWEGAWPGVGSAIGYNRVGSWYAFDVVTQGTTWRFFVLDAGKDRLGSRWTEELNWIPRTAESGEFDHILVFMHGAVFDLGGSELDMNPGGAPGELIEQLEDAVSLMKLRGVFTAGHNVSQALLPFGPFGTLQIGAGGGGAPAEDLRRWGPADAAGVKGDVQLEAMFDLAMLNALDTWNRDTPLPETVLNKAKALGSYEGFTGTYDAASFPSYGWWEVTLLGPTAQMTFRHRLPDGRFEDRYKLWFDPGNGWKPR